VSDDARQLIDQISSAYSQLKSLNLAGTVSADLQVSSSTPEKHTADFTSAFVAPNRFRHDMKDDVLIGGTGQKIYTLQAEQNVYTQAEAPKDKVASKDLPKDVATLLSEQDPSLLLALVKNPADELLRDVTDASKIDDTKIGESSYPTLKFVQKDNSIVQIMADPQSHLIRQMTFDLTGPLKQRRPDLTRAVITIDYTKVTADEPAKDEMFAWSPPPGAKDGDTMAAARPLDAPTASELEGKPAPEFKLASLDGKTVSLSDLKGEVVILDFWATWCGPCRLSLPHLDELYKAQKDKGVEVFALDEQEAKDDVEAFVKKTGLSVPVLLDSEGKAGSQYGVTGIPQTVVIGKDGKIAKIIVGFDPDSSPQELQKAVDGAKK
jgi:peroxiredoxin/outer membrane lipoprotein-sorting protein